jgi:membrane protease YdiL (CAAX protease family)
VDSSQRALPTLVVFPVIVWFLIAATVFGVLAVRIRREGGKVNTLAFKLGDFWVAVGFVTYFLIVISSGFDGPQHAVTTRQIVKGGEVYLDLILMLGAFMQFRGINPFRQFGVTRLNVFRCLGIALGLVLCVHGFTMLTENLTLYAMHGKAEVQSVIEYFLDAAKHSDRQAMILTALLAVVVAPVAEETLFRGYLYGVFKRYLGGIGAGLLTAVIFAAMHLNMAALPALFVLALCLTVAYEATGSLLVNIFMHSLFNLTSLVVIMLVTKNSP